jgi:hypothetical protein
VLERVEVFQYLGHLLLLDDNDIQAVRNQLRKARGTWARIRQVLRKENAPPRVSTKFYKAIVQSILLYGSERQGLRGSISAWRIGWRRSMCLGGGYVSSGSTHPRIRCWRSVECAPLNTTSMCGGSRSQSMLSTASSMRNAKRQTEGVVWCLGGGGGSRGCAWTMFDAIESRD